MDKNDADRSDPRGFMDWELEDPEEQSLSSRVQLDESGPDADMDTEAQTTPHGREIVLDDLEMEEYSGIAADASDKHLSFESDEVPLPSAAFDPTANPVDSDMSALQQPATSLKDEMTDTLPLPGDPRPRSGEIEGAVSSDAMGPGAVSESVDPEAEAGNDPDDANRSDPGKGQVPGEPVPSYDDFVFISREGRFLFSGSSVLPMDESSVISSFCRVVVDFFDSPGPGVLYVEGVHKYAPVLGRRKLQNQGELTDEFELVTLQNLKVAKNRSSLFYQLIPRGEKGLLEKECEMSPQGFLLHDSVTLLAGMLRRMKQKGPVTLALHLPKAVVVVAGDRKRCVWARRYVLADRGMLSLADGLGGIVQDLLAVSRESGTDITNVLWIESLTATPSFPDVHFEGVTFTRSPVCALARADTGGVYYSSLPGLMDQVADSKALTNGVERNLVRLGKWEKWILGSLFFLACMLGSAGWWLRSHSNELEQQVRQLSHQKHLLQTEYASLSSREGFSSEDMNRVESAIQVATTLQRVGKSAPLAQVWNVLAELRPVPCRIQALEVTYLETAVKVRLEGVVDLGLTQAQAVYTSFLEALKRGGFVIKKQSFQLDVDSNFFSMILEKPFTG